MVVYTTPSVLSISHLEVNFHIEIYGFKCRDKIGRLYFKITEEDYGLLRQRLPTMYQGEIVFISPNQTPEEIEEALRRTRTYYVSLQNFPEEHSLGFAIAMESLGAYRQHIIRIGNEDRVRRSQYNFYIYPKRRVLIEKVKNMDKFKIDSDL